MKEIPTRRAHRALSKQSLQNAPRFDRPRPWSLRSGDPACHQSGVAIVRYSKGWSINVATKSVRTYLVYHELAIQLKPDQIDHLLLEPLKDEQDRTRDAKELCKHQRVPTWVPKQAESQGLSACRMPKVCRSTHLCLTSFGFPWFSYSALHLDSGQTSKLLDSIHVWSWFRESEIVILEIPFAYAKWMKPSSTFWHHLLATAFHQGQMPS